MARNLLEKAGRIQVPPARNEANAQPPSPSATPGKPKTAPGTLMGFMANQSEAMKENEALRSQVARFDGSAPTRRLDASKIAPSAWANRHSSSFDTVEFAALRAEIAQAGGNVQPIKVRPLMNAQRQSEGVGPSHPPGAEYEIVFGHRRHKACLELGLPVLALIEEATEQELFVQMERENRNRADLSAWEQGVMYAKALDQGLYKSNRQLALAIGRDLSDVGRALSLARLPDVVIKAFATPLDLQFRWAKPLNDLQQSDPDGLLQRAKALAGRRLPPKETFAALLNAGGVGRSNPGFEIMRDEELIALLTTSEKGHLTVKFQVLLDDSQREKIIDAIRNLSL